MEGHTNKRFLFSGLTGKFKKGRAIKGRHNFLEAIQIILIAK
jgi:hypothetical protein